MQHSIYIDKGLSNAVKLLAAVMISMHHYSQYVCANHLSDNIAYRLLSSQGGYLGVAIFFLLSGYGLMEREQKHPMLPREFVSRRLMKVYLPVLLVTMLWLPVYYYVIVGQEFLASPCLRGGGGIL